MVETIRLLEKQTADRIIGELPGNTSLAGGDIYTLRITRTPDEDQDEDTTTTSYDIGVRVGCAMEAQDCPARAGLEATVCGADNFVRSSLPVRERYPFVLCGKTPRNQDMISNVDLRNSSIPQK